MTHCIHAANGQKGDLHEFRLTSKGTALITAYDIRIVDLTPLGMKMGPVWDCVFQEIQIDTGDLVFEWRASDHLRVEESRVPNSRPSSPFDWFHINSVDKDPKGNFLVSSRYFHSIFYIDGKTGEVIWTLGGKNNNFTDLSGGKATNFAYQHDARWDNDYREITLFDNSHASGPLKKAHPRGVRLGVDQVAMTVEVLTEYKNPTHVPALSQGSLQTLPNGNVLIGFGQTALFAEFTHDGQVLCETHYGPQSRFGKGDVQSYRVLKFHWQASPITDPDLAVSRNGAMGWRAYASWNGATKVSDWILQGTDNLAAGKWRVLDKQAKNGFETDFIMKSKHPDYIRALALDSMGNTLGSSQPTSATKVTIVCAIDCALNTVSVIC